MLWVLKRAFSVRRVFWAPKTHIQNHNFTLIGFAPLDVMHYVLRLKADIQSADHVTHLNCGLFFNYEGQSKITEG